jgi:hypothetical protein
LQKLPQNVPIIFLFSCVINIFIKYACIDDIQVKVLMQNFSPRMAQSKFLFAGARRMARWKVWRQPGDNLMIFYLKQRQGDIYQCGLKFQELRKEPHYRVLPTHSNSKAKYILQSDIVVLRATQVNHEKVVELFSHFDGAQYIPRKKLKMQFPLD